jgi:plastocyanin
MKFVLFLRVLVICAVLFLIHLNLTQAQQTGNKPVQNEKTESNPTTAGPVTHEVSILHVFVPQVLVINQGDSIRWTNNHGIEHNPKSNSKTEEGISTFVGGQLMPNNTHIEKFDKPGTYDYICGVHPAMTGMIIVKPKP